MKLEMKRNILLFLVSTLISFIIFIGIGEFILNSQYEEWKDNYTQNGDWYGRLTVPSKNQNLMWEYRPYGVSSVPNLALIQTNRYGFREFDNVKKMKPSDVYRVAFIGDSVTMGYNVEFDDTFVNKFTKYAKEKYPKRKIQGLNFGIDGYNTLQIAELLTTKVLQFKPNKVVYVMCLNDFDFEDSSGDKIRYFKKPKSFLYKRAEDFYRRYKDIDFHIWHFHKNKEKVFNKISEMNNMLAKKDILFEVVILPIFYFKDYEKSFEYYPLNELHIAIRKFLIKENIDFLDLLDAFKNKKEPPSYFAHDIWHMNSEGNEFTARKLLPFVMNEN